MLAAGLPTAIGSTMLRHSSIGITVDTYGHLSEDTARVAADAMGALLEQAFDQAAEAARDRTATAAATDAAPDAAENPHQEAKAQGQKGWAPWGSNPQPAD
jgi:hypothetical protein